MEICCVTARFIACCMTTARAITAVLMQLPLLFLKAEVSKIFKFLIEGQ